MSSRRAGPSAAEDHVAARVQHERELRGWSTAQLARAVTEAGVPLSQSAVWRIESGNPRRKISVDELIGFSRVFDLSIDELVQPLSMEYSEELVRLYVNRWVDADKFVRRAEFRALMIRSNLGQLASRFPGLDAAMREMIRERLNDSGADDGLVQAALARFDAGLSMRSDYENLDPTELIVLRREQGRTDEEIIAEAASLGIEKSVTEVLDMGITHFMEGDFAGWIPLDFLEIRDGRVCRKRAAGRAAEAAARVKAREAGFSEDLGL